MKTDCLGVVSPTSKTSPWDNIEDRHRSFIAADRPPSSANWSRADFIKHLPAISSLFVKAEGKN